MMTFHHLLGLLQYIQYNLHKLHKKLKSELPLLLSPSYTNHDFSIYDENVKLEIYNE